MVRLLLFPFHLIGWAVRFAFGVMGGAIGLVFGWLFLAMLFALALRVTRRIARAARR